MFLSNILLKSPQNLISYHKTIKDNDINVFCNQFGYMLLENRDFRKQLQTCQHFNIFGYNLSNTNNIYMPDTFLREQRFCAYRTFSGEEINTASSAFILNERKQIASHLHVSPHTTNTHYNKINKILGFLSDNESMEFILQSR